MSAVLPQIEVGMLAYLQEQPTLTALVDNRIYGLIRPQAAVLPNVMLQRSSTMRQVLFSGTDKLVEAQLQVDSYGMSGDDVWALARALRQLLVDFTGDMGGTYVDHCALFNEFPLIDPDPGVIRVTQLYTIWFVED